MIRMELFELDTNTGRKIFLQTQVNVLFEGEGKLKD